MNYFTGDPNAKKKLVGTLLPSPSSGKLEPRTLFSLLN